MDYYKEIVFKKKCSVDLSCSGKLVVTLSDTKTRWLGWSFSPKDTEKIRKALNEAHKQRKGDD